MGQVTSNKRSTIHQRQRAPGLSVTTLIAALTCRCCDGVRRRVKTIDSPMAKLCIIIILHLFLAERGWDQMV